MLSPHKFEVISLYADGPCGNSPVSTRHLTVQFFNCTCPIGFKPISTSEIVTGCECHCDPKQLLSPYVTNCNSKNSLLIRVKTNAWIM